MNDLCNMYWMQYITDVHKYFSYLFHPVVQLSTTWHSASLDFKWHTSRLCKHSHHTMATIGQFTWSRDSKAVIASTCYESYRNSSQWANKSRYVLLFTPFSNAQLTTVVTTPRIQRSIWKERHYLLFYHECDTHLMCTTSATDYKQVSFYTIFL